MAFATIVVSLLGLQISQRSGSSYQLVLNPILISLMSLTEHSFELPPPMSQVHRIKRAKLHVDQAFPLTSANSEMSAVETKREGEGEFEYSKMSMG